MFFIHNLHCIYILYWLIKNKKPNDFFFFLQEKEAFIVSQLKTKGLTLRDEDGEVSKTILNI